MLEDGPRSFPELDPVEESTEERGVGEERREEGEGAVGGVRWQEEVEEVGRPLSSSGVHRLLAPPTFCRGDSV